jgi:4-amino-4-deoxy-L-arabinose transferase-like glycosyltransferase
LDRTRDADALLLAIVFVAYCASTMAWTLLDKTPPSWDPSDHLRWAYDYYSSLAQLNSADFLQELFSSKRPYPPLVHLGTAAVFLALGATRLTGILINLLLMAVLMISVRAIGAEVYRSRVVRFGRVSFSAGAIAALIAVSCHFTAWLIHDAFLDFPLAALVAAGFAALVRANDFSVRSRAVAFGVVAALGLLTKQTFAFFFLLPGLHTLAMVIRSGRRASIVNLAVAFTVAAVLSGIWYVPHFDDVMEIYRVNRMNADVENEAPVFSTASILYYWRVLLGMQMQIPLAIAFLAGSAWSLWRMARRSVTLYLWLAGGILAFTFIANKDARYTVPILPAAALLSVSWIGDSALRQSRQRIGAIVLALSSCVSFANAQWPGDWSILPNNYFGFDHRPLAHDWGIPGALSAVTQDSPAGNRPLVGVTVNLPHLNPSSVAAYARLMAPPGTFGPPVNVDWLTSDAALERIEDCEYLIVRSGLESAFDVSPVERGAAAWLAENADAVTVLATLDLPPGYGNVKVYKRR